MCIKLLLGDSPDLQNNQSFTGARESHQTSLRRGTCCSRFTGFCFQLFLPHNFGIPVQHQYYRVRVLQHILRQYASSATCDPCYLLFLLVGKRLIAIPFLLLRLATVLFRTFLCALAVHLALVSTCTYQINPMQEDTECQNACTQIGSLGASRFQETYET